LRARREKGRADEKAAEAIADRNRARDTAAEARRNLYVAHMNVADAAVRDGHTRKVQEILRRYESSADPAEDLRGWEWHYLHRSSSEQLRSWNDIQSLAVHPTNPRWVALIRTGSPGT